MKLKLYFFTFGVISFSFLQAQGSNPFLDAGFGTGGKVITNFYAPGNAYGQRLVLRPDSGFYVVGSAGSGSSYHMAVASYLPDGKADTSFGVSGKIELPFGAGSVRDHALCYHLETDGLLIGGYSINSTNTISMAVQKVRRNGSLDSQWGTNGRVSAVFGKESWVCGIYGTPGGGWAIIGSASIASDKPGLYIEMLDSIGQTDTSFMHTGKAIHTMPWPVEAVNSAQDKGGNIYLCGQQFVKSRPWVFRLNKNLLADSSYGNQGSAIFPDTSEGKMWGLTIQPDQKLLTVGYNQLGGVTATTACRFLQSGVLDDSFAGKGRLATTQSAIADFGRSVTCAPGGDIYLLSMPITSNQIGTTCVIKLHSDGKKDETFGSLGSFVKQMANREDNPADIALDLTGKILVAGSGFTYNTLSGFSVVRLIDDPSVSISDIQPTGNHLLYPNPSNGTFYFQGLENADMLRVWDATGKLILEKQILVTNHSVGSFTMPEGIQPGMYFVALGNTENVLRQCVTIVSE